MLDAIEDEVKQGGYIIDWHACDLFPKSWIDLVVVLRVDSTILYDRLKARFVAILFLELLSHPFWNFGDERLTSWCVLQRLPREEVAGEHGLGDHGGPIAGGQGFLRRGDCGGIEK